MISLLNQSLWRTQLYIGGEWTDADSGHTFAVNNPATGAIIAQVANGGASETRRAIVAADIAQRKWKNAPAKTRSQLLRKWFDLVVENQEDLAQILTLEQGKPLAEARREIAYGASYIEWFAEEAKRIYGDVIAPPDNGKRILVLKQPVGVVAAITPWNFPNAMLARKLAPAVAAGCSIVVKPAAQTPLSALALAVLAERAGIPAGVINIVCGEDVAAIGSELTQHPALRKLSFTGSTAVGKKLLQQCAAGVKKVTMELGGNAPFIVFDDADMDAAVAGAMASKFRNSGQTCVCANRFYIQAAVYDEFVAKISRVMSEELIAGDGFVESTTLGPLISPVAVEKARGLVADAVARGAVRKEIGQFALAEGLAKEYFYPPTLLLDVPPDAALCNEELFAPVVALIKFTHEEEVVALANATEFGLAAYFYSQNSARIWRLAEQLEVGMVGVNEGIISNEMAPFGGIKQSGWGREGSAYGMEDYVNIKYLCIGSIS
ncbi:MAG TPA: NAD-dependent succinate-semialdehyde dehydrogenase [Cellvibrio sp.]|nr:NAD-dependent succinate-semialdehyde dehydrogenase [Cellvibrio sp.]